MAKVCSFASWNVEQFHGKPSRVDRVVGFLQGIDPDVFALFEVTGKAVFRALMDKMPSHSFSITENTRFANQEILIGVRRTISSFVTQREEFRAKVPSLRPGALATLELNGDEYSFLFLHAKYFDDPRDWGLRDDMFKHVASLKRKLDKVAGAGKRANFLCLGDLNTMGLNAPYNNISDLSAAQELKFLTKRMSSVKMDRLSKTHEESWWSGKDTASPSALDHVFAAEHLKLKSFSGKSIRVVGWPEETTKAKQRAWINKFSDHGLLYGEIHS